MATTLDIVTRAFRRAGITDKDTPLEAVDAAQGLILLNSMMHGWKAKGVDVLHVDLVLTDTFPLPDEQQDPTVYLLTSRVADEYGVADPSPRETSDWFRVMQALYPISTVSQIDTALLRMPSTRWRY